MEIRLLGPVELSTPDGTDTVGPPQRRAVLAALAFDAGRAVPLGTLIDRVWEEAPDGAHASLYAHVARLRRLVGPCGAAIRRRGGGYALELDPDHVDLHRLRRLLHQAGRSQLAADERAELLRTAMELWRGTPLAGVPGAWAARVRHGIEQQCISAAVAWGRSELWSGRPDVVAAKLAELVAEHLSAEPLAAALMQALVALGRRAEALEHYQAVRRHLADELGTRPGPELEEIYKGLAGHRPASRVDRGRPAPARIAVPAELPLVASGFTGRRQELHRLDQTLIAGDHPTAVAISVVTGMAGVGKTALALHWAHRAASRFPDGQLYADLRGYDAQRPLDPAEVLARFLRALGLSGADLAPTTEERSACLRTLLAARRVLVVLDNAASAEQVRPLLPGSPPSAVLVTSRDALSGLVAREGARRIRLDPLPLSDAVALLRHGIGGQVDDDPAAAVELVERCHRLPLAVRIAGELAADRSGTRLRRLAADLAKDDGLALLSIGDDPRSAVSSVFSWSFRHLPEPTASAFRRLGQLPGEEVDVHKFASLTGNGLTAARHDLDLLAREHLVIPDGAGRYRIHHLLRTFARTLANTSW